MSVFPEGFLWGAATAGHQVEGGNVASDSWAIEQVEGSGYAEPSGDACDHYHRFGEDLDLVASAGLNAYRYSVEWSRVEPERGQISRAALQHYRRVTEACVRRGLTPFLTLNHFAVPIWFARDGAWSAPTAVPAFVAYSRLVMEHLGDLVRDVSTINEPNLAAYFDAAGFDPYRLTAEGRGDAPAFLRRLAARIGGDPNVVQPGSVVLGAAIDHVIEAHLDASAAVRIARPDARIGWTLALVDVQAEAGGEELVAAIHQKGISPFLQVSRGDDYVGVQTYTRERFGPRGHLPATGDVTQTGWEFYPESLGHTVQLAWDEARVPIVVTENGIATADDARRIAYTDHALRALADCIASGIDVRGYFHWSLLDNFEWQAGFDPMFGLVAVDRVSFRRSAKPSLAWLGRVARSNGDSIVRPGQ